MRGVLTMAESFFRYQVKVTAPSGLNIRTGAGTNYKKNGVLKYGSVVTVNKQYGQWYYLEDRRGWINKPWVKFIKNLGTPSTEAKPTPKPPPILTNEEAFKSKGIDSTITKMLYDSMTAKQDKLNASTRLFGAPYQFTKAGDFRLGQSDYDLGRKYTEVIVAESPIVYFLPGKPNYLPDLSDVQRKGMETFLRDLKVKINSGEKSWIQKMFEKMTKTSDSRYFDFISDYATYMRYVNLLCRASALYLGLKDRPAPGTETTYLHYDWSNYRYLNGYKEKKTNESLFDLSDLKTDPYDSMMGNYNYTQFYVDVNTSFSESFQNQTGKSALESGIEKGEDIIKELSFLTNTLAMKGVDDLRANVADNLNDWTMKTLKNNGDGILPRIFGLTSSVMSGSNLAFPEIWKDATYTRSYNITINLVSPYGDKESVYLNIIVPLMHLLALALPRQTTANTYASPFLVKASAKGWFSCEMGIIDNITIEKGGQDSWSVDNLPTEVKVTLSLKDLYGQISLTPNSRPDLFLENYSLFHYLAVTCGVDITSPHLFERYKTLALLAVESFKDIPGNVYNTVWEALRNKVESLWKL